MVSKIMPNHDRRSVGIFLNRQAAEQALYELRDSGFSMEQVSIVARDREHESNIAGMSTIGQSSHKAEAGATTGAVTGGALGGIAGLLVGLGVLAIPGIGPIMLAGATATALATTAAGGAIGAAAGGLLGGLIGLGIPEAEARRYQDRVSQGGYLVIIDGSADDIARAESILQQRGIEDYGVYSSRQFNQGAQSTELSSAGARLGDLGQTQTTMPHGSLETGASISEGSTAPDSGTQTGIPVPAGSTVPVMSDHINSGVQVPSGSTSPVMSDQVEPAMQVPAGSTTPVTSQSTSSDRIGSQPSSEAMSGGVTTPPGDIRSSTNLHRSSVPSSATAPVVEIYDPTNASASGISEHPKRQAIGVFSSSLDVEAALMELRDAGFPMDCVSLIGQDTPQQEVAGVKWETAEAIGSAAGGLGGALVGLPERQAQAYRDRLAQGDYLLLIDGSMDEVQRAEQVLSRNGIRDWQSFDADQRRSQSDMSSRRVAPDLDRSQSMADQAGRDPAQVDVYQANQQQQPL